VTRQLWMKHEQAKGFGSDVDVLPSFSCSDGWPVDFKKCCSMEEFAMHGEANDVVSRAAACAHCHITNQKNIFNRRFLQPGCSRVILAATRMLRGKSDSSSLNNLLRQPGGQARKRTTADNNITVLQRNCRRQA
jgi:hypothetical protein